MAQLQKVGKVSTAVFTDPADNHTKVVYHNTAVVSFDHESIELNTGGWETATTKTRMNQASNQYSLGYQVYQRDYTWFVDYQGETFEFEGDRVTLYR